VTKTITNPATVIVTKLKVVPDSAKIEVLNKQIDELKKENADLDKQIVELSFGQTRTPGHNPTLSCALEQGHFELLVVNNRSVHLQ
jgi:hypothetical protein